MRCVLDRPPKRFAHWEKVAAGFAGLASALTVAAGVWLSTIPAAPRMPDPVDKQAELLADVVAFVETPKYQSELLAKQKAVLAAEQAKLKAEAVLVANQRRSNAIDASYQDVDRVVPVRDGQELMADGDASNTVIVSCEKTELGFDVVQRSRGMVLEGRNAATCIPGVHQGGETIATTGELSLGWKGKKE